MLEQLQKNQKAITSGLDDLLMIQQLPVAADEVEKRKIKLPIDYEPTLMEETPQKMRAEIDKGFTPDEIDFLKINELFTPSDGIIAVINNKLDFDDYNKNVGKLMQKYARQKGNLSKNKQMKVQNFNQINELTKNIKLLQKYRELNRRSEIRIHKTSEKYKKLGSGIIYYNNPEDLLSRLELLGGSILVGNNGVKDEFSQIVHALNQLGEIDNNQLIELLKEYVI